MASRPPLWPRRAMKLGLLTLAGGAVAASSRGVENRGGAIDRLIDPSLSIAG
jgi:hypothetical protein